MNYIIKNTSATEHTVAITLDEVEFNNEFVKKLKLESAKLDIKGFRAGKVPVAVAKTMIGEKLSYDIALHLAQNEYAEIIKKENIEVAGSPFIDKINLEKGKAVECVIGYSVFPEVSLPKWSDFDLTIKEIELKDGDVEGVIGIMRKENVVWSDVKRAIKKDDRVTIDYEGSIDGDKFDGGSAKNQTVVIGEGKFLKDLEEALIGMKMGDEKTADVDFPEKYHNKDFAGKKAQFLLKVNNIEGSKLPELNEEFFKKNNYNGSDLQEFSEEIKNRACVHIKTINFETKRNTLMKGICDELDFDVPNALVKEQEHKLKQESVEWFKSNGGGDLTKEMMETMFPLEQFTPKAKERIKNWLIFEEIIKKNEIKVDDDYLDAFVEEQSLMYKDEDEREKFKEHCKSNANYKKQLSATALEKKVVDFLFALINVSVEKDSYMSVMDKSN